jgi:hypothetical protein
MENGILVEHWDVIQDEATRRALQEQRTHVRLQFPRLKPLSRPSRNMSTRPAHRPESPDSFHPEFDKGRNAEGPVPLM